MLKAKQLAEQGGGSRYPNRDALAEIRQSYLMRQPVINDRYPTGRKPVNIKPDYCDCAPNATPHKTYNKFTIEKPSLPYYVVPVLYVPQKVLSSEEISHRRAALDKQGNADYFDIYHRKIKDKVKQHLLTHDYNKFITPETHSDSEYDSQQEAVLNSAELDEKSASFINRSNSGSTVNDQSSISSPLDDISESQLEAKVNFFNAYTAFPQRTRPFDPITGCFSPGFYKPSINQRILQNVNRPSNYQIFTKYRRYPETFTKNSSSIFQREPFVHRTIPKSAQGDCKDYFWNYKNVPKPKDKKQQLPCEGNFESDSICGHDRTQDREESKRKEKICIDCLKDKYLVKEQLKNGFKEGVNKNKVNPPYYRQVNGTNTFSVAEDIYSPKSANGNFQRERDSSHDSEADNQPRSARTVLGYTRSTQTLSATKITSGTQTEIQVLSDDLPSSGVDIEVPLLNRIGEGTSSEPIRDKTHQQIKVRASQIPQPTVQDIRSFYSDLVRQKYPKSRVACEHKMTKRKKKGGA